MTRDVEQASAAVSAEPGGAIIVALAGVFDLHSVGVVEKALLRDIELTPQTRSVMVDLAAVTFFDSVSLGIVIYAHYLYEERGIAVRVRNANGAVERVLHLTGLDDLLS